MSQSQLTPYLLDHSLIEYTTALTRDALKISDSNSETTKRANLALDFFISILDSNVEEEKQQLDVFLSCKSALNDPSSANHTLNFSGVSAQKYPTSTREPIPLDLTPAQRVLNLPDTLDVIFSHVSTLSKSGRDALYAATLTSTAFYSATQLRLWRRPRDLDTVEQQVRFAFGVAISATYGESLGEHVKRLRIRWQKDGWNTRLIKKIVSSCLGVRELTIHWGDAVEGVDPVTQGSVEALHDILASLPNLTHLYLLKFCATEIEGELQIPEDAYLPFSKLEELQLYDFHWYWKPISQGLGAGLKSLDIGFGTLVTGEQLAEVSPKTTGLNTLRLSSSVEIGDIRSFTSVLPNLERIDVTQYNDLGDTFVAEFFVEVAKLEKLKEVSLNLPIGSPQIDLLAKSTAPFEDIVIKIVQGGEEDAVKAFIDLVNKKHRTLKNLYISFDGDFLITPTDEIVTALSSCSQLEKIYIDFDETKPQVSDEVAEKLLAQCPNLVLNDTLETLVKGKEFYEAKCRSKLEKERDAQEDDAEGDVLGN